MAHDARGEPIELGYEDFYSHVHVLGLSGKGKSRALEHLLRQLLLDRTGFTLIDPHGSIYTPLLEWLSWQGRKFLDDRTVHLFDPSESEFCPGYNPLSVRPGEDLADRVDWFMETVSQMLGGEDLELMQRYQLVFGAFVYALSEKGYTIAEVPLFLPRDEVELRARLSRGLGNRTIAAAWRVINSWTVREYGEFTGSFLNRMLRILRSPAVERVFGQTESCLDVLDIMDRGETPLVNLKPRPGFPAMPGRLLGKLLINEFTQTALHHRAADTSRPHILVIDEYYHFLGEDIPDILDQTRKYGLHLVLSHQRLGQLRAVSDNVCDAVMAGAQTKIIFGSDYKTGTEIADEVFGDLYDLQKVKEKLRTPVVVGHERQLLRGGGCTRSAHEASSEAEGEGEASSRGTVDTESEGWSTSSGTHGGSGQGSSTSLGYSDPYGGFLLPDPSSMQATEGEHSETGWSTSEGSSYGRSRGNVETEGTSRFRTHGRTEGSSDARSETWAGTLTPVIEWLAAQPYSLDEHRHMAAVEVMRLDRQQVVVKRPGSGSVQGGRTVTFDRPYVKPETVTP